MLNLHYVGTYEDENKEEGEKSNEDELFSPLFSQILLCIRLVHLFLCFLRFDDEG